MEPTGIRKLSLLLALYWPLLLPIVFGIVLKFCQK